MCVYTCVCVCVGVCVCVRACMHVLGCIQRSSELHMIAYVYVCVVDFIL